MAFKLCFKITFVQKKHCWLQSAQFVTVKCHNVWHSCSHLLHQSDVLSECIQWGVAISITCTTNQCSLVKTIKNKTLTTTHHSAVTGAYISFNIAYDDNDKEGSSAQIVQNSLWRCSQQIFCCMSFGMACLQVNFSSLSSFRSSIGRVDLSEFIMDWIGLCSV